MHHLIIATVLQLLLFSLGLQAQTPFMKKHQFLKAQREYGVNEILQDREGLIWFASTEGLVRYDGINYKVFTTSDGLADNRVNCICESPQGELWLGHKGGEISIFSNGTARTFLPEEGTGSVPVTDILFDQLGHLWYSSLGEGVYRYNGKHVINYNTDDGLSDNYAYKLLADSLNRIWVATDYGLSYLEDTVWFMINSRNGLSDNIVRSISLGEGNELLIGTEEGGVCILNLTDLQLQCLPGWLYGPVNDIIRTSDNRYWVGTQSHGVIYFTSAEDKNIQYRPIGTGEGLISAQIIGLKEDRERNVWMGGQNGVMQSLPPVFEFLNESNGLPFNMVYSFKP